MNQDLMNQCLAEEGLTFTDGQKQLLADYDTMLQKYNTVLKMVKAEGDEFIIRHYADSLIAVPTLEKIVAEYDKPTVADLGSGAGLPGIPLAIAMPSVRFALIERMEKRAIFLKTVVSALKLANVEVVCQRLCEVEKTYEIVTCRAFHPFYDIEGEVSAVLKEGGTVLLYKGRTETVEQEMAQVHGPWKFQAFHVHVPNLDAERVLCIGKRG